MGNESDYLVRNAKLIVGYLTDIFKKKCILSAHFGENNASFLTAIVELDPKNNTLKLDCAPTEPLNQQLLNSPKVLFRTEMDGIKVSFSGKAITKTKSGAHAAFSMPIPASIFWMQRRHYYRVRVPLSHVGSYCEITFRTAQEDGGILTQTAMFRLSDISIGGVSFLCPDAQFARHFESDKSFTECTLYLHESNRAGIGLVVKDITEIRASTTTTQHRIGCVFTEIAPTFESCIQRYMQDIERQIKNIG